MAIKNAVAKSWSLPERWDGRRYSDPSRVPVEPGGGGGAPGYTPIFTWSTHDRANGQNITGNGWVNAINGQYSNAITGPFGEPVVGRFLLQTRAQQSNPDGSFFGGVLANVASANITSGSHLYFRLFHYFPLTFCHSAAAGSDAWGWGKWFRFDWPGDPGPRTYFHLAQDIGSCRATSVLRGGGTEGITTQHVQNEEDQPADNIPRGVWVAIQVHVYFHATNGYAEIWIGDQYQGREILRNWSNNQQSLTWANAPASGALQAIVLGDYQNGGTIKEETMYLADAIATTQIPTTLDSGGRPYISPTTRARDFA